MKRILPLIGLLGLLSACIDPDAPVDPGDSEEFVFEVPAGATASGLGPALIEVGLINSEWSWKLALRGMDGSCLKAGSFHLSRSMSLREVMQTLCGPPLPDDVPFTVVEGWRVRDIDAALAERGWIEPGAYAQLARSKQVVAPFEIHSPTLEGYLYPETYMVPAQGFDPAELIARQLQTFDDRFLTEHADDLGERSLHDVVIMASMLEREEPDPANRRRVAGILWKRLDHGWQLGVDATSHYKLPDWNDRPGLLRALRDPDDPYNTRLRHGLPPTAIGNPSVSSLEAALAPEASPYWFYLHDPQGGFHGGRNAAEHDANRARYGVY